MMYTRELGWTLATILAFGLAACDVTQTEEGEMPDVDVNVDGGKLPKYDVDSGDIDVEKKDVTVTVPTLDYDSPQEDEREEAMGLDGEPEPEPETTPPAQQPQN